METKKLFDNDPYAGRFEATVLAVRKGSVREKIIQKDTAQKNALQKNTVKKAEGGLQKAKEEKILEIILDQTLFFPEEGGQTPDTGTLAGFPVVDVRLDGDVIRHYVRIPADEENAFGQSAKDRPAEEESAKEQPAKDRPAKEESAKEQPAKDRPAEEESAKEQPAKDRPAGEQSAGDIPAAEGFAPGRTVTGRIDFAHRFSNMQNHSGEHILSGLVHGKFGYDNVGFHLSDNTVTLDFNGPLSDEDILWLETAANRVVWDDLEIRAWYPDEDALEKTSYRSKKEIDGPLRLVEIPGVDVCACCAPHVRRTGEIGMIKIIRTLREKGGIRLTILCGSRALEYLQQLQKAAEDTSHLTNMPREEIAAGVARLLDENERLRQRESALETMVTNALAASVPERQENVFLFTDGIGNLAQRNLVNLLCASRPGYCGVFNGSSEAGYKFIIGAGTQSGADRSGDARILSACLRKNCGARGGGKPAMVQGSVQASEEEIRAALDEALGIKKGSE